MSLSEPQAAICGNGVVEDGEECDCGWEEDCLEKCCWPMKSNASPFQKPCTLRPRKVCSPSQVSRPKTVGSLLLKNSLGIKNVTGSFSELPRSHIRDFGAK